MQTKPLLYAVLALTTACVPGRGYDASRIEATVIVTPDVLPADGITRAAIALDLDITGPLVPDEITVTFFDADASVVIDQPDKAGPHSTVIGSLSSDRVGQSRVGARLEWTGGSYTLPGAALVVFTDPTTDVLSTPSSSMSSLRANPSTLTADGVSTSLLTLTARNAAGTPLVGQRVVFTSTGTRNVLTATDAATDGNGVLTATLASTRAEIKDVTATVGLTPVNSLVVFEPGPPDASRTTTSASNAGVADGMTGVTVTTVVQDAQGNPVPNDPVTITPPPGSTASQTTGVTDANGVFTTVITTTTAGNQNVAAVIDNGNITTTTPVVFDAGPAVASNSNFDVTPASVLADGVQVAHLTVILRDAYNNLVTGSTVTLSATGTSNTFDPPGGPTDLTGTFTATLSSTRAENKVLMASGAGTLLGNSVLFFPGSPSSVTSTIVPDNANIVADGVTTENVVVTVDDAFGNPITGVAVHVTDNGTNVAVANPNGVTNAQGQWVSQVSSTVVQSGVAIDANINGQFVVSASVNFIVGPPSAATTTFVATPSSLTADGISTSTLRITVLDALSRPVANQGVVLTSTGSANTFNQSVGTTDATGVMTALLSSTYAEIKNVTATVGVIVKSAAITFTAGSPSSGNTSLSVSPSIVTADGSSTSTLSVTVADAQGNPVSGQSVTFAASGTNNMLSATTATTDLNGLANVTLASTKAEAKTVTATTAGITKNQIVSFVAGPVSGATSSVSANPTSLTADGANVSAIRVSVTDAQGNPINAQSVALSVSGAGNSLSPTSGTTGPDGVFAAALTSTVAQVDTVQANVGGTILQASVTFVAGAASSSTSTLVANPNSVQADGTTTSQLTVTMKDAQGNLVKNQAVSLSSTGSNNTFTPVSASNPDASGTYIATIRSSTAELKKVTATMGAASLNANVLFAAGAPSSTTTSLVLNPTTTTADGSSAVNITYTVEDAEGNAVASQAVTFVVSGANNTLNPNVTATNGSGVATATLTSTLAQLKTVTASTAGISQNANAVFQAGAPASFFTTFVASPNTLTADGVTTSILTLQARDAQGNPVLGQAVSLNANGTGNTFSTTSGTTDSTGSFAATLSSTVAQTEAVSATVASVTKIVPVTFQVGPPSSTRSTLTATPSSGMTADGSTPTTLLATIQDTQGNPISGALVTFSTDGSGNSFPLGTTATTDGNGKASVTLASTKAESKNLQASAGGATATTTATFVAGAPASSTSTFAASPNSVAADGVSQVSLVTTVLDAMGNPVSGQSVNVTLAGTNNSLSPPMPMSTDANGRAIATLTSTAAQTETATSSVNASLSLLKTAQIVFTVPTVSITNSTVQANPNQLVADGVHVSTVSVQVLNGASAPVTGQAVTFSSTGTGNAFPAGTTGTTDGSGAVTFTLASTKAEGKTVTVTVDGTALNANVLFVAGNPNALVSSIVATPNSVVADGSASSTLTVFVQDAYGNPVSAQYVTFTVSGSNNTIAPQNGNTDATGTVTATLKSTTAQAKNIMATVAGNFNETTTVTFVAGAPASGLSAFTATPLSLVADGTHTSALTFTAQDASGNPVAGQRVSLTTTGTNYVFSPQNGNTNSSGIFASTLSSTHAEVKTVTATAGSVSKNAAITFTAGAPSSATSTLVANPNTGLVANGVASTNVTFTLTDAQGNPVGGQAVTFTCGAPGCAFGTGTGTTDPSTGAFTSTLASTNATTQTITAATSSLSLQTTAQFVAGPASSGTSTFVASPTSLVADNSHTSTLTVTVRDAQNNAVSNQAVSVAVTTGSNNTLTPLSGSTSPSGIFTAALSSSLAEVKTVTATIGAFQQQANVTFTAGVASNNNTTFTANPNTNVVADGVSTSALVVTVADAFGNPVKNQSVSLTSTGSAYTFGSASGTTNASGMFSTTYASTHAELKMATATAGGVSKNQNVIFVAGPASSSTSTVSPSPSIIAADGVQASVVTVNVVDAYGNPISGAQATLTVSDGASFAGKATDLNGNASFTYTSTVAGNKTLTASINAGAFQVTANLSVVAGSPASANTSLLANPNSLLANGSAQSTLTVNVADAFNNPVTGQAVSIASDGSGNSFGGPQSGNTVSGVFSVPMASTVAQTKHITATVGGFTKNANVTFNPGPPSATTTTVTANPNSVPANNSANSNILVTVLDSTGNAVAGQSLSLGSSGTNNTFGATIGSTDSTGHFSTTLVSSTAETKTVTATVTGFFDANTTVVFTPSVPSSTNSTFTATSPVIANNSNTSTLTVTVKDASGNAISGQAVTFTGYTASDTLSATTGTTLGTGIFSATMKGTVAGAQTISANFGGVTLSAAMTFVAGPPAKLTFTSAPTTSPFAPCALSPNAVVSIVDAFGNATTATNTVTVTLGNAGAATLGGTTSKAAVSGAATFVGLTISKPATGYDLVAASSTFTSVTSATFSANAACSQSVSTTVTGISGITGISAADVNNDGYTDLVLSSSTNKTVRVLYNNGSGGFGTTPAPVSKTLTAVFSNVVAADLNGDGWADLALTDSSAGSNSGVVYINAKSATAPFGTATSVNLGANANNIVVYDMDVDGDLDLVAGLPTGSFAWVLNSGTGTFASPGTQSVSSSLIAYPYRIDADKNGTYEWAATYPTGSSYTQAYNFNNGGVGTTLTPGFPLASGATGSGYLWYVSLAGSGKFNSVCKSTSFSANGPRDMTAHNGKCILQADMNADGAADVLVCTDTGYAQMLRSTCNFGSLTSVSTAHQSIWLTTGDFNKDGIVDVATANYDDNSVSVILNP